MSTRYDRLAEPWTSLRLEEGPAHDRLTIWENHANVGTLTVTKGLGKRLARLFSTSEDNGTGALRSHWGGPDRGTVVTVNVNLPDDATVVSEYGEVMTVAQVKARDGAKRKDGYPTELFGFEDRR